MKPLSFPVKFTKLKFTELKITKRTVWLAAATFLLVLGFCLLLWAYHSQANRLLHEQAAQRWTGDSDLRFSQVSVFLPGSSEVTPSDVNAFREKIKNKLLEVSLEAEEGKSLYVDAYSGKTTLTVTNGKNSASVLAIGGSADFFFFHPLPLRSGSYLSSWDLMQDRVVLDESTAWLLFGSYDVAGKTVTIQERPYVVAGVVSHDPNRVSAIAEEAENTTNLVYLDYSQIEKTAPITCYELVMPNPISDFAAGVVRESFVEENGGLVLENTKRFRAGRILDLLLHYGRRLMATDGVAYPSWENAARLQEVRLGRILLAAVACALLPLVLAVVLLVKLYRKLYSKVKKAIDDRRIQA